jgi:hypothetical protein
LDQFMRAWNSYRMSVAVGNPSKSVSARTRPAK